MASLAQQFLNLVEARLDVGRIDSIGLAHPLGQSGRPLFHRSQRSLCLGQGRHGLLFKDLARLVLRGCVVLVPGALYLDHGLVQSLVRLLDGLYEPRELRIRCGGLTGLLPVNELAQTAQAMIGLDIKFLNAPVEKQ